MTEQIRKAIKSIPDESWEKAFEARFGKGAGTDLAAFYRDALERIARCNESNLERYVRTVDDIACEALAKGEAIQQEERSTLQKRAA